MRLIRPASMNRSNYGGLDSDFWKRKPLIGMVHLPALPGSPQHSGQTMDAIISHAVADAQALEAGGATAVMVENFFDSPFTRETLPAHTIAALTLAVGSVRANTSLPIGVNALRNDAVAGIAIAHICGAQFVRINVFVGAAVTDQGIIQGAARAAVLCRKELGADVAIFADVFVKHAVQLGGGSLEDSAKDAGERGLADALIVSGTATGADTDPDDARRVKIAVPNLPILIGSGFRLDSASALLKYADGAIVGTSVKRDCLVANPVDTEQVRQLRTKMDGF
jgi:membrane complex biogenesis BtpA family protein